MLARVGKPSPCLMAAKRIAEWSVPGPSRTTTCRTHRHAYASGLVGIRQRHLDSVVIVGTFRSPPAAVFYFSGYLLWYIHQDPSPRPPHNLHPTARERNMDPGPSNPPAAGEADRRNTNTSAPKMRLHGGNIPTIPQDKLCPHCPAKFTR